MQIQNTLDREKHQKLYVQLYTVLKAKIENSEWVIGAQIPTEDELCKIYEVSKATVKLAVLELVREGYLKRKQGKGTFVCKRSVPEWLTAYKSFRELITDANMEFTTQILVKTVIMPSDDIERKLNVPANCHIIYIKRLRIVQGEPYHYQQAYVPYHVCPDLLKEDLIHDALFDILEKKFNIKVSRVMESIEIERIQAEGAGLLKLEVGAPVIVMEQQFFSKDDHVMYVRTVSHADKFRFSVELERSTDLIGS
jgi:DNA-binding GntR family transcriptional regulator